MSQKTSTDGVRAAIGVRGGDRKPGMTQKVARGVAFLGMSKWSSAGWLGYVARVGLRQSAEPFPGGGAEKEEGTSFLPATLAPLAPGSC